MRFLMRPATLLAMLLPTLLAAAVPWLSVAPVARAACGVTVEAVARAEVAFVGTLTEVSADGAQGTFDIEDVWRSAELLLGDSAVVEATPGMFQMPPAGAPAFSYLVLAQSFGGILRTGQNCSVFPFPWDASYAAYRPADAPAPPGGDAGLPIPVLLVAAAAVVLILVGLLAFRRGGSA